MDLPPFSKNNPNMKTHFKKKLHRIDLSYTKPINWTFQRLLGKRKLEVSHEQHPTFTL